MACRSVPCLETAPNHAAEALALIQRADFLTPSAGLPEEMRFFGKNAFCFRSAVATPWEENNLVYGRLYRSGKDWAARPTVILLHGWNGELGYYLQFPFLARRLNQRGLNAAMIELSYHGQRKPEAPGAITNFISHDLLRMAEATRQSVADIRALLAWLLAQGSPAVGVWGFSLGAWLAGLMACHEPETAFAVLLTPVVRMDGAIERLPFCEAIRRSLQQAPIPTGTFNLASHELLLPPERMLIVASQHDLFAPAATVEELWEAWGRPQIWRVPHGHISVLMSLPILERTVRWIDRTAAMVVAGSMEQSKAGQEEGEHS